LFYVGTGLIRVGSNVRLLKKLGYAVREHEAIVHLWPAGKQNKGLAQGAAKSAGRYRPSRRPGYAASRLFLVVLSLSIKRIGLSN